jgi:starvation-inducible DNA-binding protein
VKEAKNVSNGKEAMQNILEAFKTMISLQREIADAASDAGDEGTNALMSDYIREQEKLVWMYSAYLK